MKAIRIYTTSHCGFCRRAKDYLRDKGLAFEETDVAGSPRLREWLVEQTGQWTVPQIFVGERSIGGFTDLIALDRDGGFEILLGDSEGED